MGGRTDLDNRLEGMVKNLLNEYVVTDKTFRVSAPSGVGEVKTVFGHTLTEQQLAKLAGFDGIVALFSVEAVPAGERGDNKLKPDSVQRRANLRGRAQQTIAKLEPWLGKPVLEVWQGIDQFKNIFGDRSIYVCCFFGLKEEEFPTFVTEKAN